MWTTSSSAKSEKGLWVLSKYGLWDLNLHALHIELFGAHMHRWYSWAKHHPFQPDVIPLFHLMKRWNKWSIQAIQPSNKGYELLKWTATGHKIPNLIMKLRFIIEYYNHQIIWILKGHKDYHPRDYYYFQLRDYESMKVNNVFLIQLKFLLSL